MILGEDSASDSGRAVNALETFQTSEKTTAEDLSQLLQHPNALRYFKFNLDQYCEIHRLKILKITEAAELEEFLKNPNTFQKALTDQEQFHSHFLKIVLPILVEKCNEFKEIFEVISDTLAKCLFSSREFLCYLSDQFETDKCFQKHSLCKSFIKFSTSLYPSLGVVAFKLFFHSFCKTCRIFRDIYRMFLYLLQVVGFELKEDFNISKIKYQVQDPELQQSLAILNELLNVVTKLKVELEHDVNGFTFSDFLKNILKSVMSLSTPNGVCYRIFFTAIEINPLLVESVANETFVYIMLGDNSNCKNEYETLIIKIFDVFNKLHRVQNLIAKMIPILKLAVENDSRIETVYRFRGAVDSPPQNALYNVDTMLPKVLLDCFTNSIVSLASWQVINVFKTMLFHLNKAVEELPEGKTDCIYMEILSSFTCWILQSARIAEHTVAETTVTKFVAGLDELKGILAKFGGTILQKEHNHVLMRAFLNICFYWAEMYMLLEYYSSTNQITMEKNMGTNISSCNITYLHSYLGEKEWYLIFERINNFGEKPCKEIMQKLMIQKLRALQVFNVGNTEDVTASIIRTLSSDFDEESEIFMDDFVVNNLLNQMPATTIISLSEVIVRDLINNDFTTLERPHISDSQLLAMGILTVIFTRINKLLKQKRKHDDVGLRKALFSRAVATLPPEILLGSVEEHFGNITEIVVETEDTIDLKLHEGKIELFLDLVAKINVVFCPENVQKLVILLLMALRKDLSCCSDSVQRKCETVVISVVQHNRFTLLDLFETSVLLRLLGHFVRCDDFFFHVAQNVFKSDKDIAAFESGITYIKEHLKDNKCLRFAVVTLHQLGKVRKSKVSSESKETCNKYKSALCGKLAKRILKSEPEESLIEAFALVLKAYLVKDENDTLSKLKVSLDGYLELCLVSTREETLRGCLLLFTTTLHNKWVLGVKNELVLRIWNTMKNVAMKSDTLEEYSQLVMLVTTLIPNEQFSEIFPDLLKSTANSIDSSAEFSRHLKTWSCIVSTNFNPFKTNVLREQLEFLLEKLLLVLKSAYEEVIQFEISIIQANHVPLTAPIMDFLLLSVSTSLMSNSHDFVHCFNSNVSLLENLLKYRKALIMDRLPPYLLQYRVLLKELCLKSSSAITLTENEAQRIADCAHKFEKLTRTLVECTKDMARIAMYLIADILKQYETDTLYPNVKKHLNNCLYSLISLCDHHAVQYLMRVLSNASTEIFKIMYENYKKYYRFTGKV